MKVAVPTQHAVDVGTAVGGDDMAAPVSKPHTVFFCKKICKKIV
jgi:hypothetical protein